MFDTDVMTPDLTGSTLDTTTGNSFGIPSDAYGLGGAQNAQVSGAATKMVVQ